MSRQDNQTCRNEKTEVRPSTVLPFIIGSKYLRANIEDIITMVVIRPVVF